MARHRTITRLDFEMSAAVATRLADIQDSVRAVGHARPTPRTLISALILAESRRGADLEAELLMPFRKVEPDAD